MRPPSIHSSFFSSLKQVEKRLKSEDSSQLTPHCSSSSTDHLGSPIFLNYNHTNNSSSLQDSDPPQDFLSHSIDFPPTQEDPTQLDIEQHNETVNEAEDNKDDIEQLIELLGLSELKLEEDDEKEGREKRLINGTSGSCFCDGGFYSKIAGVNGPKCEKEMERLNGWIKYLLNDGEEGRSEPLSLVYLLLGRAACADGLEGLEFPSTIEEFLQNDPPK